MDGGAGEFSRVNSSCELAIARGVSTPDSSSKVSPTSDCGGVISCSLASASARFSASGLSGISRSRGIGRFRFRIEDCGIGANVEGFAPDLEAVACAAATSRMVGFDLTSDRREWGHVPEEDSVLSGVPGGRSTAPLAAQFQRVTDLGLLCSFFCTMLGKVSIWISGFPVEADRQVRISGTARP